MKRVLVGLVAGAILPFVSSSAGFAHGGQFRGPGGGVPPNLRDPSDPTPPAPPPPTQGPPPVTGGDPTPPPTGPVTPNQPPGSSPPPQTLPDGPAGGPGRKTAPSFDQWVYWWNNNNDDVLHLKESIYQLRITGGVLAAAGGSVGARNDATRATEAQLEHTLVPALLWAMDRANRQHPDIESAGYLALAKVTNEPAHIALLEAAVQDAKGKKNAEVDPIVNESAALSLGLLRRGDKARQFDAKELDRVRDFLFEVVANETLPTRTRGFAMLSLGLLGDQPTAVGAGGPGHGGGAFYDVDPTAPAQTVTQRVFDLLRAKYADEQLYACALLALSMQDPATVTGEMIEVLRECGLKARLFKQPVLDVTASYAVLALGRVGTPKDIPALLTAMRVKQTSANVKRSAAISLGRLGQRIDGPERAELAVDLWRAVEATKETSTKNFGLLSLAYLLEADIKAERTDILDAKGAKVAEQLLRVAESGRYGERPYGALALGLLGRAIGERPRILEYGQLRLEAVRVLRDGLRAKSLDKRSQAAFATALGMLRDEGSKKDLVEILKDRQEDKELRGYAAVALGLIGTPTPDVTKAIKDAMREHSSEELRSQTAIALGLLGSTDAVPTLLDELKGAESQNVQGQVVIALAKIGDARAIEPMVALLRSDRPDLTRALACAGLGLIGDLEWIPSLSRLSKDINYLAVGDVISEVLSILYARVSREAMRLGPRLSPGVSYALAGCVRRCRGMDPPRRVARPAVVGSVPRPGLIHRPEPGRYVRRGPAAASPFTKHAGQPVSPCARCSSPTRPWTRRRSPECWR